MIEFYNYYDVPKDFTGVCKILWNNSIRYFKNGKLHNEYGHAIEYQNGEKHWIINGLHSREDGPAVEYANGDKDWFYKGEFYGFNDNFTIKSWEEKVRELKMEIFK